MKTAMQELIEEFKNIETLDTGVQIMILRGKAEELLPKEREQIESAFNDGVNDECLGKNTTPKQYYETAVKKYGL